MIAKSHMLSVGTFIILPIALTYEHFSTLKAFGVNTDFLLLVFFFFLIFGSLLPDIDEPNSKIGRISPPFLTHSVKAIFGHRGVTHTVIFILPFLVAYYYSDGMLSVASIAIALGIFSHILGDLLTKGGVVNLFYPLSHGITFGLLPKQLQFYTASLFEYFFIIPLFLIIAFLSIFKACLLIPKK